MAQKLKNDVQRTDPTEKVRQDIQRKVDLARMENKNTEIRNRVDEQVLEYQEALEKFGAEHYITKLKFSVMQITSSLLDVLDIVLTLQSMFNDINMVLTLVDDSLSFIDNILRTDTQYGFFKRMGTSMRLSRFSRNLNNRLKVIGRIGREAGKLPDRLQKSINRMMPSISGKKAKKGGKSSGVDESMLSPEIQAKLAKAREERGLAANETGAASGSVGANSGSLKGGDDISDIL